MQHRAVAALLYQVQQAVQLRGEAGEQDHLQEALHQRAEGKVHHGVHAGVNIMMKLQLTFRKASLFCKNNYFDFFQTNLLFNMDGH